MLVDHVRAHTATQRAVVIVDEALTESFPGVVTVGVNHGNILAPTSGGRPPVGWVSLSDAQGRRGTVWESAAVNTARRRTQPVEIPAMVREVAPGRTLTLVWENEVGGLTFEGVGEADRVFVKWAPRGSGLSLQDEAERLRWARPFTPVPAVVDLGEDADGGWMLTTALPGRSAVGRRWRSAPEVAVTAIGRGLRALHDALPVEACPFTWSVEERVAHARHRAFAGEQEPARWHQSHRALTVGEAITRLDDPPLVDVLVVCHGDACAPNTLLDDHGDWTGHVDLGAMGVADPWADLAVATWSTEWNYGAGWEQQLLDAYGVDPDPERIVYYRLLWDLT
jgi:kanamycin kinase